MRQKLTKRQNQVYEFIRDKIQTRGYGPTVREISNEFGIKSPNGVICHLKALERKGLISRKPNQSRAIELTTEGPGGGLPFFGKVTSGQTESANESLQVDLNRFFKNTECYMLQVSGDSMIDAHIADGDFVVVEPRNEALDGEIVVAETEDGSSTVKYWHEEMCLHASQTLAPTVPKQAKVSGVVVGVVRKCC